MNDKGEVVGVADAKRLLEDIPNKVKNTMGIIVDVDLMTEEGKSYIRIEPEPCGFPLNYKGDYFIRSGATLQMLQGSALTHFRKWRYERLFSMLWYIQIGQLTTRFKFALKTTDCLSPTVVC